MQEKGDVFSNIFVENISGNINRIKAFMMYDLHHARRGNDHHFEGRIPAAFRTYIRVPKGNPGASMIAHILVSKFTDSSALLSRE